MHSKPARSRRTLRWLIPALLLLVWIVIGGIGGPFAGKLGEVQQNDNTSFLPAEAESTQVAEAQRAFSDNQLIPAVVIAENNAGITPEDTAYLTRVTASLSGTEGIVQPPSPPILSPDGKAVEVIVGVDSTKDPAETVTSIRDALAVDTPPGLSVYVTGPAGQAADLTEAFSGIDGTLLMVAGAVVIVILLVVYRSPLLPLIVVVSAVLALALASALVYLLAKNDVITLNGQSQGILFILVFGAATDYALLLVARYREELQGEGNRFEAMGRAMRGVIEPILASGGTVILGVLCLLFSELNSNRGLGPVAAIGIATSLLASLTFLPAALVLVGRSVFWPARPKQGPRQESGAWWRLADYVSAHRVTVSVATGLLLLVFAAFLPQLKSSGVAQSDVFLNQAESVEGEDVLSAHFPAGSGSPTIIIAKADRAAAVIDAVRTVPGVSQQVAEVGESGQPGGPAKVVDGTVQIQVTLADAPDSEAATATVERIRAAVHPIPGADALVGGTTATQLDTQTTSERDRTVIIPIVLLVVFLVLAVLLRAIVAPLLLIGTVVLSFAATLGVSALLFNHVFDFPGSDPVVPLFGFVFLVALGVDYNIFLMTRVREESLRVGTRDGIRRGLAVTGGVITSAGIVLAATFGSLAVLPILFLAQLAFIVAFGVLLDTLIVRSLLVPALAEIIGPKVWWPSKLASSQPPAEPEPALAERSRG
ncbi:efflux RND transporter permease subunit [Rhodococcus sp. X156]|uniref:MMPL family transporter n=1 Tax=Rhodococcus sp. X156 TaxID=2499145 RepID=UPI000FD9F6CF|nr:efflux RND transporter permease subunit [Rhodococcus sp. X156]